MCFNFQLQGGDLSSDLLPKTEAVEPPQEAKPKTVMFLVEEYRPPTPIEERASDTSLEGFRPSVRSPVRVQSGIKRERESSPIRTVSRRKRIWKSIKKKARRIFICGGKSQDGKLNFILFIRTNYTIL